MMRFRFEWLQGNRLRDWSKCCRMRNSVQHHLLVKVRRHPRDILGDADSRIQSDHRWQAVIGQRRELIGRCRSEPVSRRAVSGRHASARFVHLHFVPAIRVRTRLVLDASEVGGRSSPVNARQIKDPVVVNSQRRRSGTRPRDGIAVTVRR